MSAIQAKTINLLLEDGSLNGVMSLEDTSWNAGELYSAPRESVENLFKTEACKRYGVYLLISESMVYVGQASDLKRRIKQHIVGKNWWERVIVLTTSDDRLNKSDIDYLEYVLIEKAKENNVLDCDNKAKGNPPKVSKFNKVSLNQYLDEALFLLELIGVTVFSDNTKNVKTLIPTVKNTDEESIEIRAKGEAKAFLEENGVKVSKQWTYASKQRNNDYFWANPNVSYIDVDWTIVLNNQFVSELVILEIPAKTLRIASQKSKPGLRVRNDNKQRIDLNIDAATLKDKASKIDFSPFVTSRIKY